MSAIKKPIDWRWRLYLGWLVATALTGGLACLAPLTETLGYELSLVAALIGSAGAGHLAACYPNRVREQLAPFPGARWPVLLLYGRALAHGLTLLIPPLLLSLLNGLRVPPCNVGDGLVFFALLPIPSVALATAAGLLAGLATPGPRSATVVWFSVLGAALGLAMVEAYRTPAVYSFGPFHGYFPGVLYDELIRVDTRIYTYRLATVLQLLTLLGLGVWLLEPSTVKLSLRRGATRPRALAVAALFLVAALAMHLAGPRLGHRTAREDLERSLPRRVEVAGLELFFPADADPRTVAELTDDAAFSLHQVERFLEAPSGEPIAVFFFASYDRKRAAMGASRTNVAKPWRGEVYVTVEPAPHLVLRHELAHAVAARFSRGPLAVAGSLGGLWPDPGLIEGLAAAAQGPRSDLTVHQWAAAMKRQDLLPPLGRIFGLGFLDLAQSTAYTAAGSFCRFVHDEHGAEALRRVYGGESWHAATGKSAGDLERAWHSLLDRVTLDDADLAAARHRFDRPSVLRSVCVHEVARLRAEAARSADNGAWDQAIGLLETAHARSGGTYATRIGLLHARIDAGDVSGAQALGAELLADPGLGLVRSAGIREILADLDAADEPAAAAEVYGELASKSAREDHRRVLQVKHYLASSHPKLATTVLRILARRPGPDAIPEPLAMLVIADAARSHPDDPILAYLVARQHFRYRDHERALDLLDDAERLGLPETTASLWLEARMMRGQALFRLGRLDEAERAFEQLADDPSLRNGVRERARDWADRCAFASSDP